MSNGPASMVSEPRGVPQGGPGGMMRGNSGGINVGLMMGGGPSMIPPMGNGGTALQKNN